MFCGLLTDVLGCYNIGLSIVGLLWFDALYGAMFWCDWIASLRLLSLWVLVAGAFWVCGWFDFWFGLLS